jgi:hypothetical protein
MLGHVGNAALKGDLARARVPGDNVGLGADNMEHDVAWEVSSEFGEPDAHLDKGLGVGDGVAEDAGVGAAVIETGYAAEAFLPGCGTLY